MDRNEAELLLPFYANGTLDAEETRAVEAVLAKEPDLRLQLDLVREDQEQVVAENETVPIPSAAKFNRMLADAVASAPAKSPSLMARLLEWWEGIPSVASAAVAAAAIVLVLFQAAIIGMGAFTDQPGRGFQTASGGDKTAMSDQAAAFSTLVIRFDDAATAAQISELLAGIDAEIVSGPRAGGLFTLKLNKPAGNAARFDALIKDLNSNSNIMFAQKAG